MANPLTPSDSPNGSPPALPDWVALVIQKVESLRYGVVQLIVHDGRVTQIERTEKTRIAPTSPRESHE